MRFPVIVLLAATALLSSVDGRSTGMITPDTPAMPDTFTAVHYDANAKIMQQPEGGDEERGITDKITGWINSSAAKIKMRNDLKTWPKNGDSVDDVLARLKLNTGMSNILENPTFKNLQKYIAMYNKKFPDSGVTMVGTLTARYGDDAVARALEAGKWSENLATNALAKKLQGEQFRLWLEKDMTPLRVFKQLELNRQANKPLGSDTLAAWRSYLAVFNYRNPKNTFDEITVFRRAYGDRGLAKLLLTANWSDEAQQAAKVLQRQQFEAWSKNDVSPKEVFTSVFKFDGQNSAYQRRQYDCGQLCDLVERTKGFLEDHW